MKNILKLLLAFLILSSCQKAIEINFPDSNNKLVINSLFTKDSLLTVNIFESTFIKDTVYNYVDNLNVLVYENDIFWDTLKNLNQGKYISTKTLKVNYSYKIEINSQKYNLTKAIGIIPQKVVPLKIKRTNNTGISNEGTYYSAIEINFDDPAEVKNYYQLVLKYKDTVNHDSRVWLDAKSNPGDSYNNLLDDQTESFLFSDEFLNGKNINIKTIYYRAISNSDEGDTIYTLYAYFNSISEEMYKYQKSLQTYRQSNNNPLFTITDPYQFYSNIENGFGIFAGYNCYVDSL